MVVILVWPSLWYSNFKVILKIFTNCRFEQISFWFGRHFYGPHFVNHLGQFVLFGLSLWSWFCFDRYYGSNYGRDLDQFGYQFDCNFGLIIIMVVILNIFTNGRFEQICTSILVVIIVVIMVVIIIVIKVHHLGRRLDQLCCRFVLVVIVVVIMVVIWIANFKFGCRFGLVVIMVGIIVVIIVLICVVNLVVILV